MAFVSGASQALLQRARHSLPARRNRKCPRRPFLAKAAVEDFSDDLSSPHISAGPSHPFEPLGGTDAPQITPLPPPASRATQVPTPQSPSFSDASDPPQNIGSDAPIIPNGTHPDEPDSCQQNFVFSPSLQEYRERREAGLVPPVLDEHGSEWSDAWALAIPQRKASEMRNQYSRVSILVAHNFPDFQPARGCAEAYKNASLEEIAMNKAIAVYDATGLPAVAEMHDLSIDAPESGSRINKTLQQGYYTRLVEEEGDAMIDRVRPISDESRLTRFNSVVVYYDGEMEIVKRQTAEVAIAFSQMKYSTIATAGALDELYKHITRQFGLKLDSPGGAAPGSDGDDEGEQGVVLVGATMLKERILRDGKMLNDSIIKVSSFLNHMVDTELMEVCGEELAERLRRTMPNKVLTVESTGLIVGLPTARKLGIPLVFARKTRPITISDSYQTTYRSATKGTTSELIVSCEYLEAGDRVLIIDDFLAGGSTAEALFKLAKMAHAKVVGVGVLIEKMSDGGRAFLSGYDVPVESLAKILPGGDRGRISFVEEGPWVRPEVRAKARKKAAESAIMANQEGYTQAVAVEEKMAEADIGSEYEEEAENMRQEVLSVENVDNGEGVDVISWDDEGDLDDLEEELIRKVGKV